MLVSQSLENSQVRAQKVYIQLLLIHPVLVKTPLIMRAFVPRIQFLFSLTEHVRLVRPK